MWYDQVASVGILNVGAGGLVALFIIALMRGALVPRKHVQDLIDQRDKWESAYWKEKEAGGLQDKQNVELLETARTMKHFIEAFPRAITEIDEGSFR